MRTLKLNIESRRESPLGIVRRGIGTLIRRREEGEVVIPMIAFIEGRMRIPMGIVIRDFLKAYRLAPTQCAPNMFRILGSVDTLNEKMGLNLTHHDINWVYNLHHLEG